MTGSEKTAGAKEEEEKHNKAASKRTFGKFVILWFRKTTSNRVFLIRHKMETL